MIAFKPLPLLLLLALCACVQGVKAPSLAPRPIERRSDAVTEPASVTAKPIDPTLDARIAALLVDARKGDAEFRAADASSGRTIAAGRAAAEGSERWIAAQIARSALEAARQHSGDALAALDAMLVAQAKAATDDPELSGFAKIEAAEAEAQAIVTAQTTRLDALSH